MDVGEKLEKRGQVALVIDALHHPALFRAIPPLMLRRHGDKLPLRAAVKLFALTEI
jgi:hypothetical protein